MIVLGFEENRLKVNGRLERLASIYDFKIYEALAACHVSDGYASRYHKMVQSFSESEPRHDKTNKVSVCPAKTQISLGIRPV